MESVLFRRFQHAHSTLRSLEPRLGTRGFGGILGRFIAMAAGTILFLWPTHKSLSIPAFVLVFPLVFMLSPGSHGLRQLETWASGKQVTGVQDLSTLGTILPAIGIAMVIGRSVSSRWDWLRNRPVKSRNRRKIK